jgi:rare lipoprotein A
MQRPVIACIALLSVCSCFAPLALASESDKKPCASKQFIGLADYYHHSLYGKKTASGQILKKELLTAAHRTLPFGTRVHVVNKRTGRSCDVIINDRGPFTKSKVIDLSHAAANKIGLLDSGTAAVACTVLPDQED